MRLLVFLLLAGCSSTFYYPDGETVDSKGIARPVARKAFHTYGDSIGPLTLEVHRGGLRYTSAGGLDHSTGTRIVTREAGSAVKWGIGWGFSYGILNSLFGHGASAYNANQATQAVRAANAPKAAPLPSVGSTIPAQTSAIVTPVP